MKVFFIIYLASLLVMVLFFLYMLNKTEKSEKGIIALLSVLPAVNTFACLILLAGIVFEVYKSIVYWLKNRLKRGK
ncbi:MAG: hypothetical protein U0L66_08325 [Acutalibacteraceae bacterium]|nr:hypothetical protein [Acutalibacteraceae bacterium]